MFRNTVNPCPSVAVDILLVTYRAFPYPQELDVKEENLHSQGMHLPFWLYLLGASFIAAGYADFPLIAYHFHQKAILSPMIIPVFYAIAVGLNSITAPILGYFYDHRYGFYILIVVSALTCFFAPLVFLGNSYFALLGVICWSIGVQCS